MVMKTLDGIKSYLYFLMDNYSRLIINWRAELKVSGKIRLETIEEAYHK
jgi:putative transposase